MSTYEKRLKEDLKILGGFLIAAVIISAIFIYLNSCNKGPTRYVLDTEGNIICSHKSTGPLSTDSDNNVYYSYTNNWSEKSNFYNSQSGRYNFETNNDSDTLSTDNYISSFGWDFFYNSPKDFAVYQIYELMYFYYPNIHTNYSCTLNNGDVYLLDHRGYDAKYGIANKFGIWKVKPDFSYIDTSYVDKGFLILTTSNGLMGVMNLDYEWILEPKFHKILIEDNCFEVMKYKDNDEYYGAYDFDGQIILDTDYHYVYAFGNLIYFDKKDDDRYYCGICDLNGNIILEPSYEDIDIDESSERIITEDSDGNYMLLDFSDNDILGESFKYIECLKPSYDSNIPSFFIIEDNNGKYYICDKDGNKLVDSQYDYLEPWLYSDDYIIAEIDGKRGLIDRLGNIYIDFEYKEIIRNYNLDHDREDNCIVITEDDCVGIVDFDNKTVIEPQKYILFENDAYSDYSYADDADILFFPCGIHKWVILSADNDPVEVDCYELEYLGAGIFKACSYTDSSNDSLIDYKGQFISELRTYNADDVSVSAFNGKPLIAIINSYYGTVFYDGLKVLDTDEICYHCISNPNGTVLFWTTEEAKVYSAYGEYLGTTEDTYEFQESLVVVKDESTGLYGLVGTNGELILDFEYKYIENSNVYYYSDNKQKPLAAVQNQDGQYGIVDAYGNWIYEPQFDWASVDDGVIQVTLRWGQKVKK